MSWSAERKVGLFTLLGLGAFAYTSLFLSHITLFPPPEMDIVGEFSTVDGLKEGNPIRYSGVPIGKVESIEVGPNGVRVLMSVDKGMEIPEDSNFSLQTDGLLGEKFISIEPGKSKHMLTNGQSIKGEGRSGVDQAFDKMDRVLTEADKLLSSINKLVGDEQMQGAMKASVDNAAKITGNLVVTTNQLNYLLAQNTGNINNIATHLDHVTHNLDEISKKLDEALETVDNKGETAENIRDIIANVKDTSASLKKMSQNMETVLADQETAKNLQKTINNVANLTSVLNGNSGLNMQTNLELLRGGEEKEYLSNMDLRLKFDKSVLTMGANSIGNGTRLDFNAGREFSKNLTARAGIFDGDIGASIDYGLVNKPLTISVATMDFNDPRYRIRGELKLFDNVRAVAQYTRPYSANHSGNYYGIQYNF